MFWTRGLCCLLLSAAVCLAWLSLFLCFIALLVVALVCFVVNSRVDTVCVLLACLSLVILLVVVRVVLRARASRAFLSLLTHSLVFLSFSLFHFFALLVVAFVSFIVNSRVDTVCVLLACLSLVVVVDCCHLLLLRRCLALLSLMQMPFVGCRVVIASAVARLCCRRFMSLPDFSKRPFRFALLSCP